MVTNERQGSKGLLRDVILMMLVSAELGMGLLFIGLLCLGASYHSHQRWSSVMTVPGWLLVGTYFFLDTDRYVAHDDAVLTVLSAAALPVSCFVAWAEITGTGPTEALRWLRGAMFWAAVPYLAIAHVPWIHVAGIWLIAANTVLFLRFTGAADVHLGQITVVEGHQRIAWADWGGSRWFHLDPATEYPFLLDIVDGSGRPIGINIILGCTALQSMVVFIGACVPLASSWRRKIRALVITLPVIHVLNVFRNAGIIWLVEAFPDWRWMGLDMFDFSHTYLARVVSLGAMFLLATVLFDVLPELHRHILRLLPNRIVAQPSRV